MSANNGMWVVATTYQGGGTIDELDGPYWSEADAEAEARAKTADALPRHDLFQVYLLTGDFSS